MYLGEKVIAGIKAAVKLFKSPTAETAEAVKYAPPKRRRTARRRMLWPRTRSKLTAVVEPGDIPAQAEAVEAAEAAEAVEAAEATEAAEAAEAEVAAGKTWWRKLMWLHRPMLWLLRWKW